MSPYSEMIRLYGLEQSKDRMREAEQWRLLPSSIHPTWLARQGCRFLCWLGGRLIRVGQYLQDVWSPPSTASVSSVPAVHAGVGTT
jgi:hypothetical protein